MEKMYFEPFSCDLIDWRRVNDKMAEYKGTGTDSNRIARLAKAREDQQKKFEESKRAIEDKHRIESIRSKFASNTDDVEQQLKQATVGLVSYEDFKRRRQDLEQQAAALAEESKKDKTYPPPLLPRA